MKDSMETQITCKVDVKKNLDVRLPATVLKVIIFFNNFKFFLLTLLSKIFKPKISLTAALK